MSIRGLFAALVFASTTLVACAGGSVGIPVPTVRAGAVIPPSAPTPLLFAIGVHIEPLGPTAQLAATSQPARSAGAGTQPDYNTVADFNRGAASINAVAAIAERHGGRLTVQTQSPFTTTALRTESTLLSDLEDRGHEIGLHLHEDAHLGRNAERLPEARWCEVLNEEVGYIHQAGVDRPITYWSGGNLYPHLLSSARCAGLSVNSDWKDPATQQTPEALIGTVPWRPAGSPSGSDVAAFSTHDPAGGVIFLPEGNYDRSDFAASRRSDAAGGDEAYFRYLKDQVLRSVATAEPGKVNVFHFTIHPGEFRGSATDQFGVIDRFLSDVVAPLVAEGKVAWATFSEMAAAFEDWEAGHPGIDPRH